MATAIITLIVGFALGLGAAFVLKIIQSRSARQMAEELLRQTDTQRQQQVSEVIESVKASFGKLSLDALSQSTSEFLKLAKGTLETQAQAGTKDLDSKKSLIDIGATFSPPRRRGARVCACTSLSPITTAYGIFASWASRIL